MILGSMSNIRNFLLTEIKGRSH